mgnify:FL=1
MIKLRVNLSLNMLQSHNSSSSSSCAKENGGISEVLGGTSRQAKVAILLCTYQGQKFLAEQLDSFCKQSHENWEVWASDDGSSDDTHQILERYLEKWETGRISLHSGPAEGFVANFLSLSCKASIQADYYAYSDQDDVWAEDKLGRAVAWLNSVASDVPALYCSRTCIVDERGAEIGLSPLFSKKPSFANALIQNIGGGNTMVYNRAARALLMSAGDSIDVVSHDWWAYILVSGAGGEVYYDPAPEVLYRQHQNNLVGANVSWVARSQRLKMLLQGRFRKWNDRNIKALQSINHLLIPKNLELLELFIQARKMRLDRKSVV